MKKYLLSPVGLLSKKQIFGSQDKNTTIHYESESLLICEEYTLIVDSIV